MTSTIIDLYKNKKYRKKLQKLFSKTVSYDETKKLLFNGFEKKHNDIIIYKTFSQLYNQIKKSNDEDKIKFRTNQRAKEIQSLLREAGYQTKPDDKILDVGCYDGAITKAIYETLMIKKENAICVESLQWVYTAEKEYVKIVRYEGSKLPFPDQSFNIVLCLQVLHHIENLETIIKEIRRILKPNGIFIIKEHDNVSSNMTKLIDIEHFIYIHIVHQKDKIENYYANYKSIGDWTKLITQTGFQERIIRRIPNTATNYYYALYEKQ